MRPLQYKSRYLNLRILELGLFQTNMERMSQIRQATLSIDKYRNANSSEGASVVNLNEKNRITGLMRRNTSYSQEQREAVARCYSGKGSVLDCQKAVQVFISLNITESLQAYCDQYLGLDCSGFVNCYFNSNHGLPKKRIRDYYTRGRSRERLSFEDFRENDVLIWCDSGGGLNGIENNKGQHIAIINSIRAIGTNDMRATIVESTGDIGLVHSNYTIINTNRSGVYRIHRPLKPTTNNYVRVVPVLRVCI